MNRRKRLVCQVQQMLYVVVDAGMVFGESCPVCPITICCSQISEKGQGSGPGDGHVKCKTLLDLPCNLDFHSHFSTEQCGYHCCPAPFIEKLQNVYFSPLFLISGSSTSQTYSRFLRRLIFAPYKRIPENLSGWKEIIQDVVLTE